MLVINASMRGSKKNNNLHKEEIVVIFKSLLQSTFNDYNDAYSDIHFGETSGVIWVTSEVQVKNAIISNETEMRLTIRLLKEKLLFYFEQMLEDIDIGISVEDTISKKYISYVLDD